MPPRHAPAPRPVTSPTIRKRILKRCSPCQVPRRRRSYIAYDPQEDTETPTLRLRIGGDGGYIAYDPQEDTETPGRSRPIWSRSPVTSPTIRKRILKPHSRAATISAARVTSPTIRKRILKPADLRATPPHVPGYIAYDPQEDTETSNTAD